MPQPLISIKDLIHDSWEQFVRDWRETLDITVWLLVPPLVFAGVLALTNLANVSDTWSIALFILAGIASAVVAVQVTLRLIRFLLARSKDPKAHAKDVSHSWDLFWPYIWLSILQGLAVFAGYILFVLPGIWLQISLLFARLSLVEDEKRGVQALQSSRELVKGRWWPTFWRTVIPGALFVFLVVFATGIVSWIFTGLVGNTEIIRTLTVEEPTTLRLLISQTTYQFSLQTLGQIAFLPIFLIWQIRLFHSLKHSR